MLFRWQLHEGEKSRLTDELLPANSRDKTTGLWRYRGKSILAIYAPMIYTAPYVPQNALSSAMDLNFNTFFSDGIFPGIKVVYIMSKSKRLLMLSSCMVKNCAEVLKRHVWICIRS
jgi:hypothetical protein